MTSRRCFLGLSVLFCLFGLLWQAGAATGADAEQAGPKGRVLFILAGKDFYYKEYDDPRQELEKAGYKVDVTAFGDSARPHDNTGQTGSGVTRVDIQPADVDPSRYEAVVFVGGWGASMYQYGFKGRYWNKDYNLTEPQKKRINEIVMAIDKRGKTIAAICHGVTALAWCRDDAGNSPVKGKRCAVYQGGGPGFTANGKDYKDNQVPSSWHLRENGATPIIAGQPGGPDTAAENVVTDGRVVTAQNPDSARNFGKALVRAIQATKTDAAK